jgi:hypothetical protein
LSAARRFGNRISFATSSGYAIDSSFAQRELKWKPRKDFEEGIDETNHGTSTRFAPEGQPVDSTGSPRRAPSCGMHRQIAIVLFEGAARWRRVRRQSIVVTAAARAGGRY